MTHLEGTEGHQPHEPKRPPIEIGITPDAASGIIFERKADNSLVIRGRGEFTVSLNLPTLPTLKDEEAADTPESLFQQDSASPEAAESLVPDAKTTASGLLPESTSHPVTDAYSGSEKPSWEQSLTDGEEIPESENRKFQLVGNPARKLSYRVTRKSNTRIADFVLATHPEEETTEYWRIRAFGDQAEKVRDQVAVGQKGVEATVYGPKYWKGRKKTKDGAWEETVVKGYHAGFVKVPRAYRSQEQAAEQPQSQQKD